MFYFCTGNSIHYDIINVGIEYNIDADFRNTNTMRFGLGTSCAAKTKLLFYTDTDQEYGGILFLDWVNGEVQSHMWINTDPPQHHSAAWPSADCSFWEHDMWVTWADGRILVRVVFISYKLFICLYHINVPVQHM